MGEHDAFKASGTVSRSNRACPVTGVVGICGTRLEACGVASCKVWSRRSLGWGAIGSNDRRTNFLEALQDIKAGFLGLVAMEIDEEILIVWKFESLRWGQSSVQA